MAWKLVVFFMPHWGPDSIGHRPETATLSSFVLELRKALLNLLGAVGLLGLCCFFVPISGREEGSHHNHTWRRDIGICCPTQSEPPPNSEPLVWTWTISDSWAWDTSNRHIYPV